MKKLLLGLFLVGSVLTFAAGRKVSAEQVTFKDGQEVKTK